MKFIPITFSLVFMLLIIGCSEPSGPLDPKVEGSAEPLGPLNPKVEGSVEMSVDRPGKLIKVSYVSPDKNWVKSEGNLSQPFEKSIKPLRHSMKIVGRGSKPKGNFLSIEFEYLTIYISLNKGYSITGMVNDHYYLFYANHKVVHNLLKQAK